jgi:hypothetical protein
VDTVEWGGGRAPVPPPAEPGGQPSRGPSARLSLARIAGRWAALSLAVLGLVAFLGSEFLPWGQLHTGSQVSVDPNFGSLDVGTAPFGLEQVNTIGAFAYRLGMLPVLAMAGAVLVVRSRQRRALAGTAAGLIVAQALSLVSLIRSLANMFNTGLPTSRLPAGFHVGLQPGAYLAAVGLFLLLASVAVSAAPERVRAQLADAVLEPIDAQYTDEPIELTVTQAKPIEESYFTRPDQYRR